MGLETDMELFYQVCNYVDDFEGVESTRERALAAFTALSRLLELYMI